MLNGLRPLGLLGAWLVASGCADNGDDSDAQQTNGGGSDTELTWCDVEPILQAHCQRCHTEPQQNAAPFPLLTYEDTQEDERYELMASAVGRDFMPPTWLVVDPPVEPLPCSEKQTLLEWIDQGAAPPPADDPGCLVTGAVLLPCE